MTARIATANRLDDGRVVYLGYTGWIDDIHLARRAETEADEQGLLEDAKAGVAGNAVADVWLIDYIDSAAARRRERIRAQGPTVRPDLGYQARGSA